MYGPHVSVTVEGVRLIGTYGVSWLGQVDEAVLPSTHLQSPPVAVLGPTRAATDYSLGPAHMSWCYSSQSG
jgi:hypothetical protein